MKIGIISDSHDNIENLKTFLQFAKKNDIQTLIHCGDVTKPETLKFLSDNFLGIIHFVDGNVDENFINENDFEVFANIKYHHKKGEINEYL